MFFFSADKNICFHISVYSVFHPAIVCIKEQSKFSPDYNLCRHPCYWEYSSLVAALAR